jgi:hypothetical protein
MRLPLTTALLLATALGCPAQLVSPKSASVMFSNSGSFVVKVNREPWIRGAAGAATPDWKEAVLQTDATAGVATKQADDRWRFAGTLAPDAARDGAWLSYEQSLASIGDTLQIGWRFRLARDMELDLLYVSLALPAKRFAGKTIRFDQHNVVLPEQPAPATQRPITGRPQRVVIDSGTLGPIAIRFDKAQVVWVEDRRASGGSDFELRVLLATGELKAGDQYGLSLQLELAERPDLLVGGNGREFRNDTAKWLRFDLQDTAAATPAADPEKRAPTDASDLLHAPAGKFGVLQTKGGHFTWPTGARQKFWGIRLPPASAPAQESADAVAGRIAQFGINLVRWTVSSHLPEPAALARFDHFVAALARRGVYSQFALPTPPSANPAISTPLVAERLIGFTERSVDAWLLRQNSATGKRYTDDPSLAVVQITTNNPMLQRPQLGAAPANDLAIEFYRRLYAHLRKAGVKCPIITDDATPAVAELGALVSAGDAVGAGGAWDPLQPDGFVENKALVSSDGGYLGAFANASVAHKPLLITRVSHPQANEHRAEAPLLLAAHAALQDWDGVVWDDYSNDPAVVGQFPAAARVFLGGIASPSRLLTHVERRDAVNMAQFPLPTWLTYISRWRNALPNTAAPAPDILIAADSPDAPKQPPSAKPIRLAQKAGATPSALQRLWVDAARKLRAPLGWEEGSRREFGGDNGQVIWDQDHGQFGLLAPGGCAAVGFIGGKGVTAGHATFEVGTPRFAAVSLVALDGNPVATSRRLLLTAVARCENNDQRWFESLNGSLKILSASPGARLEPVNATITLRNPRAFKLFALDPAGQRGPELPVTRGGDNSSFVIAGQSMYYEMVSEGGLRLWPFGK